MKFLINLILAILSVVFAKIIWLSIVYLLSVLPFIGKLAFFISQFSLIGWIIFGLLSIGFYQAMSGRIRGRGQTQSISRVNVA